MRRAYQVQQLLFITKQVPRRSFEVLVASSSYCSSLSGGGTVLKGKYHDTCTSRVVLKRRGTVHILLAGGEGRYQEDDYSLQNIVLK